jgi:[ribosomal protein S5]-alanine N-acetyltransferase
MAKVYKTERLLLKALDGASCRMVLDYFLRNRAFLEEWEPAREPGFYTSEYQSRLLDRDAAVMESGAMLKLWIFKKDDPGRVIGSVSFSNIVRGAFQSCLLGYRLDEKEINKGYMTEAVACGISVMFGEFKLHRIEANIMPRNSRSLRVVEKLGFRNEGLAREYLKINGKWEDHVHMVLLNSKV